MYLIQLLQIQSRPVNVLNVDYADSFAIKCIFYVYITRIKFTDIATYNHFLRTLIRKKVGVTGAGLLYFLEGVTCWNIHDFNWADFQERIFIDVSWRNCQTIHFSKFTTMKSLTISPKNVQCPWRFLILQNFVLHGKLLRITFKQRFTSL